VYSMPLGGGWVQGIDPATEERDLKIYIYEQTKSLHGYKPRSIYEDSYTIDELRVLAARLEQDLRDEEEYQEQLREKKHRDRQAHRAAVKYYSTLGKTFNRVSSLKEAFDAA